MSRTYRHKLAVTPYRNPLMKNSKLVLIDAIDQLKQFSRNRDKVKSNQQILGYDQVYCSAYREKYYK